MVDASGGIPVSVKLRLGKDKKNINIIDTSRIAEDNGASIVIIHARTRSEKYESIPDWDWIKKIKEKINIPVVGNGSVFNHLDAIEMIANTGCDSVLVARGSLGNPFLFSRYNSIVESGKDTGEPSFFEKYNIAVKHVELIEKHLDAVEGLNRAKKNIIWYFQNSVGIDFLLEKIFSLKDFDSLKNILFEHRQNFEKNQYSIDSSENIKEKFKKKVLFWLAAEEKEM